MQKLIRYSILCALLLIVVPVVAQKGTAKQILKKAAELEQLGMQEEACNYYYAACLKKKDNIEAMAGLKRTGQIVLNQKLTAFNEVYTKGDLTNSLPLYETAANLYSNIKKIGIVLDFPSYYSDYYEEAKQGFLADKYVKACQLLDNERFKEAETVFREISRYNANYKETRSKLNLAVTEPTYRTALQQMESGNYQNAYYTFQNILNYKDARDLSAECKEKGMIVLLISPTLKTLMLTFQRLL